MDTITIIILFVFLVLAVGVGSKAYGVYSEKVLVPKARMQLLENTVNKVAAHNVSNTDEHKKKEEHNSVVVKEGIGKELARSFQETFGSTRELPKKISLAEALREDHPINQRIGSPFKSQRREPFHTGPYAHELTDDEWKFVQEHYQKSIQRMTDDQIKLDANLAAVGEIEKQMHRQIEAYTQARKQVSGLQDPFERDFEELESKTEEVKDKSKSENSVETTRENNKRFRQKRRTILHPDPFAEDSDDKEPIIVEKKKSGGDKVSTSGDQDGSIEGTELDDESEKYSEEWKIQRQAKLEKAAANYKKMQESIESRGVKSRLTPRELEKELDKEWGNSHRA